MSWLTFLGATPTALVLGRAWALPRISARAQMSSVLLLNIPRQSDDVQDELRFAGAICGSILVLVLSLGGGGASASISFALVSVITEA